MGIGTSLVLMAIGAILTWGVNLHSNSGVDVNAIGVILMVVGAMGVALSMAFWNSWGGPRFARERVSTYRDIAPGPARVSTYRDVDGRYTRVEEHEVL
jgi:hypothetical protein